MKKHKQISFLVRIHEPCARKIKMSFFFHTYRNLSVILTKFHILCYIKTKIKNKIFILCITQPYTMNIHYQIQNSKIITFCQHYYASSSICQKENLPNSSLLHSYECYRIFLFHKDKEIKMHLDFLLQIENFN